MKNHTIIRLTSLSSPIIKEVCKLSRPSYAQKTNLFTAEGVRICETFLEQGMQLYQLFVISDELVSNFPLIDPKKLYVVTEILMKKMSNVASPPGVFGVFYRPKQTKVIGDSTLVLMNLQDPGNVGTLMRSAFAFGRKTVVCIEGVDPYHPKVVHASAGYIGSLHIVRITWKELLVQKKERKLAGLVLHEKAVGPERLSLEDIIIVGNEAHGLPSEIINDCDILVTIPMNKNCESLNAAVAGSLALYYGQK